MGFHDVSETRLVMEHKTHCIIEISGIFIHIQSFQILFGNFPEGNRHRVPAGGLDGQIPFPLSFKSELVAAKGFSCDQNRIRAAPEHFLHVEVAAVGDIVALAQRFSSLRQC